MQKEYNLFPTAKKTAKANNLTECTGYRSGEVFYDFSLFDKVESLDEEDRRLLENDLMEHHSISWYDKPMPTIIIANDFVHLVGQVDTAYQKIYNRQGKRIMIIVEVTRLHIEKKVRKHLYEQEMKTVAVYDADNGHRQTFDEREVA